MLNIEVHETPLLSVDVHEIPERCKHLEQLNRDHRTKDHAYNFQDHDYGSSGRYSSLFHPCSC